MLAVYRLAREAVPRRSPRSATSFYTGRREEGAPVSESGRIVVPSRMPAVRPITLTETGSIIVSSLSS